METKQRLIDANEPISAFKRYAKTHPNATWNAYGIEEVINAAPTVDAIEVVLGHWDYTDEPDEDGNVQAYCSICGSGDLHAACMKGKVNYCWHCGAKMN